MPKLYRPYDIDIKSTYYHENPFLDVDVTASFVHEETGEKIVIPGFWKGENVWCARFAPTKLGRWNYIIESNDESLKTAGSLTACKNNGETEIDRRGFVRLSDKGRYFEYADGTPFYWIGDTNWQAPDIHRLTECNYPGCNCGSMFRHLVNKRKAQGFNGFQTYPSAADNDGGGGKIYFWWKEKYSLIDPEAFNNNFDVKMDYLLENGFTVALGMGVHSATPVMGTEALVNFTKYMVARYASYPVIWITGQEIDIPYLRKEEDFHESWLRCAETIAKYDGYNRPLGTHLYSRDFFADRSCSPEYEKAPWHQWWALQAGHRRDWTNPTLRPKSKYQGYWENSQKTCMETEAFYEDLRTEVDGTQDQSRSTGYELARNSAWMSNLCGCAGYTYGAHGVWGMRWSKNPKDGGWSAGYNSEPWFMGIEKPFANELKYLAAFFKNIDFTKLVPTFYDTTYGEFSDKERVVMATQGNELYAIYMYGNDEFTGKIKKLDKKATYKAYWYDVRTGAYIKIDEFTGVTTYPLPARPDKNDWALVITSKELDIPYEGEFYKSVALKKATGVPVDFTAFTPSTDNTTEVDNIQEGKLWRPFAAHASNTINIDLGEEVELSSIELLFEKNKTGEYSYRIDGLKDDRVYVLCDRYKERAKKKKNIEKLEGKFRNIRIIFVSEPAYINDETRLVAGIEKITVFKEN